MSPLPSLDGDQKSSQMCHKNVQPQGPRYLRHLSPSPLSIEIPSPSPLNLIFCSARINHLVISSRLCITCQSMRLCQHFGLIFYSERTLYSSSGTLPPSANNANILILFFLFPQFHLLLIPCQAEVTPDTKQGKVMARYPPSLNMNELNSAEIERDSHGF